MARAREASNRSPRSPVVLLHMGVPKVLTDLRNRVKGSIEPDQSPTVGILAFEAAAVMSRLVSLHRSLADQEVRRLRNDMRSQGVAYLTSKDQAFLLRLACAEFGDELDKAAAAVSRFGAKCQDPLLWNFDRFYSDLKAGAVPYSRHLCRAPELERLGLGSTNKAVEKRLAKMEKHVAATSRLYAEMSVLSELEASERRMEQQQRRHSGQILMQKQGTPPPPSPIPFQLELRSQRQKVRRLKEESLWNKTFDKAVEPMVRAVITVFTRLCAVFGPHVLGMPPMPDRNNRTPLLHGSLDFFAKHSSGPMERLLAAAHVPFYRNSAPILTAKQSQDNPFGSLRNLLKAGPSTVGGSGLAMRYANVVALAEKLLATRAAEQDAEEAAAEREELYEMLPAAMRGAVRAKLRECWRREGGAMADSLLAEGWREAAERILTWLGPVARDTLRLQDERNMERQQRFDTRPRALLLQTLHFADREKTEATIVEVLVGLSCACWYEDRRRDSSPELYSNN